MREYIRNALEAISKLSFYHSFQRHGNAVHTLDNKVGNLRGTAVYLAHCPYIFGCSLGIGNAVAAYLVRNDDEQLCSASELFYPVNILSAG